MSNDPDWNDRNQTKLFYYKEDYDDLKTLKNTWMVIALIALGIIVLTSGLFITGLIVD